MLVLTLKKSDIRGSLLLSGVALSLTFSDYGILVSDHLRIRQFHGAAVADRLRTSQL